MTSNALWRYPFNRDEFVASIALEIDSFVRDNLSVDPRHAAWVVDRATTYAIDALDEVVTQCDITRHSVAAVERHVMGMTRDFLRTELDGLCVEAIHQSELKTQELISLPSLTTISEDLRQRHGRHR